MSASKTAEALKLVEELEDDVPADGAPVDEAPPGDTDGADLPPSEPPVEDSAMDIDTEGNVALQLLADIKNLLAQLVGGEEGETPDEEEQDLENEETEREAEGDAADAVPEPSTDDEGDLNPVHSEY